MCGIIAIVRRASDRRPPEAAEIIALVTPWAQRLRGVADDDHLLGALRLAGDDLLAANQLLLGVPGLNRPAGSPVPSDMLRLNTTTAVCTSGCSPFGVIAGDNQGYPNGRRLGDDVIDISERVISGGYVLAPTCNGGSPDAWCGSPNNALGDGVNGPPYAFDGTFPYLVTPVNGFSYVP